MSQDAMSDHEPSRILGLDQRLILAPAVAGCDGVTGSIMGRSAVEFGVGFGIVSFGYKLDLDLIPRTKISAPYETTYNTEDLADTSTISCLKHREF